MASTKVPTDRVSPPEVAGLIEYVERLCEERPNTVLRLASGKNSHKSPAVAGFLNGVRVRVQSSHPIDYENDGVTVSDRPEAAA